MACDSKKAMSKFKFLIVGPLPDYKNHLQFGGATVLMSNFISFLKKRNIKFGLAQTNRYSDVSRGCNNKKKSNIWFLISFFSQFLFYRTIIFNFSDSGVVRQYPVLAKISKLFGKTVVLHKFGGALDKCFAEISSSQKRKTIKALQHTDLIFFETKAAIKHLKDIAGNDIKVAWYPNVRQPSKLRKNPHAFNKKLVFLSHIISTKGVDDLIKVKSMLPEDYTIDLYGAIKEEKYRDFDWESYDITYHGEVDSSKVPEILVNSLLLLLTSHREGYPGIVIESLSVGLPVIVSNVGGLPEMITDGIEGRMIKPKDVTALYNAIMSVTSDIYEDMCNSAYDTFNRNFNSDIVNDRIITEIEALQLSQK